MPRETWTFDELFEGLDPAPSFVAELERLGLLRVVARDGHGSPLYGADAKEQLDKVLSLVELGYQPRDIAAIARKVGLPNEKRKRFRRPPTYIRQAELSRRSGVDEARLVEWQEVGLLLVSMETESGEPLFATAAVEVVRAVGALFAFGFDQEEITSWRGVLVHARSLEELHDQGDVDSERAARAVREGREVVGLIRARLDALRGGIRRWDKLLNGYEKRLGKIGKAEGVEAQKPRSRRRRRSRTRRPKPPSGPSSSSDSGRS